MANRRRVSESVVIALITAGGTVAASLVTGEFGLANNGDKGSVSRPEATVTVTDRPITSPDPTRQDSETPKSASNVKYLSDMQAVGDPDSEDQLINRPVAVKGVTYEKALVTKDAVCANGGTEQDYVLSRQFSRFQAKVGLPDDSPVTSTITFYVLADDKKVKTISDVGIAKPRSIDLSVTGVTRIGLVAEVSFDFGCGATGVWIDPRVFP